MSVINTRAWGAQFTQRTKSATNTASTTNFVAPIGGFQVRITDLSVSWSGGAPGATATVQILDGSTIVWENYLGRNTSTQDTLDFDFTAPVCTQVANAPSIAVTETQAGSGSQVEIQHIALTNALGGTWALRNLVNGQVSAQMPFNAAAADVQVAVNAILGSGVATVSSSAPFVVTWAANGLQQLLQASSDLAPSLSVVVAAAGASITTIAAVGGYYLLEAEL